MQGTILCFYPEKRYGFLQDLISGEDHFFHRGDVKTDVVPPRGTLVTYELGEFRGKRKATNITPIPTVKEILGGAR